MLIASYNVSRWASCLEELAEVLAFVFDDAPGGIPNRCSLAMGRPRASCAINVLQVIQCRLLRQIAGGAVFALLGEGIPNVGSSRRCSGCPWRNWRFVLSHDRPRPRVYNTCASLSRRLAMFGRKHSGSSVLQFPLVEYALQHWVDHVFENLLLH